MLTPCLKLQFVKKMKMLHFQNILNETNVPSDKQTAQGTGDSRIITTSYGGREDTRVFQKQTCTPGVFSPMVAFLDDLKIPTLLSYICNWPALFRTARLHLNLARDPHLMASKTSVEIAKKTETSLNMD